MLLNRDETEIEDQAHLMRAEGTSTHEPSELDVSNHLEDNGWIASDIKVFYDSLQGFWRWNCRIATKSKPSLGEVIVTLK